jgi:Leucine-rich repeat (LRR) protein
MLLKTALAKKNKASIKYISVDQYSDIRNHQLSEEVYGFTALEKLHLSGDFTFLSSKIANLQNLQHLSIRSNILKELPEEIGLLKNLTYLSIRGEELSTLPQSLSKLKNLRSLDLSDLPKITAIPNSLSQLPNLEQISIYWGNTTDLNAFNNGFDPLKKLIILKSSLDKQATLPIFKLKNLTYLNISKSQLAILPPEILHLKKLKTLILKENQLKEIPAFIAKLSNLTILDFEENQVTEFPAFLSKMHSFQRIGWINNAFGKYDKALLQFPIEVTNPYDKVGDVSKYRSFITQVKSQNFSPSALALFFKIQSNRPLEKGLFKRADFIEILSFEGQNFRTTVIHQLLDYEKESFETNALGTHSSLFVLGKTTLTKSEIRSILKEKGTSYQTKVNQDTTHLLVGTAGFKNYELLANPAYTLISQQAFQHYANAITKPYLLEEENKDNLTQISSLLLSTNIENQNLGLELLKGGGTPKELLTELFIIFKLSEDKKIASIAKQLLTANAPTEILEKLKLRINLRIIKDAYSTKNKLEELTEGTQLDVWKIAQYLYQYQPYIWAPKMHLGLKNAPKRIAMSFLLNVVQQQLQLKVYTVEPTLLPYINLLYESCSFLKEIKFHRIVKNIDGISALNKLERLVFYFVEDASFPKDLHLISTLKSIEFTQTTTKDWSPLLEQLAQISSLKRFTLWSSMKTGLHPNISKLQSLEDFSCYNTPLEKESIEVLAKLPLLTGLDLSSTSANLDERYLLLKNIQRLSFHNAMPYTITPQISTLKKLKSLILKGIPILPDNMPAMPSLEELYIKTGYSAPPVRYEQIQNLTNLKRLTILGNVEDLQTMLPNFSKLEHLELYYNKIEFNDLLEALKQLPQLKIFHRYLSTEELATLQKALPNLEIKTS